MQRKWIETWHFALSVGCRIVTSASDPVIDGSSFPSNRRQCAPSTPASSCAWQQYQKRSAIERERKPQASIVLMHRINTSIRWIDATMVAPATSAPSSTTSSASKSHHGSRIL